MTARDHGRRPLDAAARADDRAEFLARLEYGLDPRLHEVPKKPHRPPIPRPRQRKKSA